MDNELADRIDDLEARIAFQDRTIEELNTVVAKQWRHIDDLQRKVDQLVEHARSTGPVADPRSEPPPPHY
jgi:SlyX protein